MTLAPCRSALGRFVKVHGGSLQQRALERLALDLNELARYKTIELCEDDAPKQVPLRVRFVQKKGKAKPVLRTRRRRAARRERLSAS